MIIPRTSSQAHSGISASIWYSRAFEYDQGDSLLIVASLCTSQFDVTKASETLRPGEKKDGTS
jgi:hypothetical protein